MASVADINAWLVLRGIGHILMGTSSGGWHSTACGTYTPGGEVVADKPARKCRECMTELGNLKIVAVPVCLKGG